MDTMSPSEGDGAGSIPAKGTGIIQNSFSEKFTRAERSFTRGSPTKPHTRIIAPPSPRFTRQLQKEICILSARALGRAETKSFNLLTFNM